MTYSIYKLTEFADSDSVFATKVGELEPAADEKNCYFGSLKLWSPTTGFLTGHIRDGDWLLVSHGSQTLAED
jgi:hypothetical protein